jgi:hypothetical protein
MRNGPSIAYCAACLSVVASTAEARGSGTADGCFKGRRRRSAFARRGPRRATGSPSAVIIRTSASRRSVRSIAAMWRGWRRIACRIRSWFGHRLRGFVRSDAGRMMQADHVRLIVQGPLGGIRDIRRHRNIPLISAAEPCRPELAARRCRNTSRSLLPTRPHLGQPRQSTVPFGEIESDAFRMRIRGETGRRPVASRMLKAIRCIVYDEMD